MEHRKIKNLADLRRAKRDLKFQIDIADHKAKNGLVLSSARKLFNSVEGNAAVNNSIVGTRVNSTLGFLSNAAESRFNLGQTGKTVLSLAIAIAAPIIAKKIQNYIDDEF